jgi:LAGLIDADG endonuclease
MNVSTASYIAGFLDGDGSIHFQLVKQKEYRFGFYVRASVSFSQSTSARHGLEHIQTMLGGSGYIRDRGTGMSDLVITSRPVLLRVLRAVQPYVIFKKVHVGRALEMLPRLEGVKDPEVFLQMAREVDAFATLNYSKTKRISAADVEQHLRSKGVLCPCNDFFASNSEEMASFDRYLDPQTPVEAITRQPLERG